MRICNYCCLRRYYLLFILMLACTAFSGCKPPADDGTVPLTAAGQPEEGPVETFKGEPFFEMKEVFNGGRPVREPYLGVALDGTILVLRNRANSPQAGSVHTPRSILPTGNRRT